MGVVALCLIALVSLFHRFAGVRVIEGGPPPPPHPASATAREVKVGMYVVQVRELDLQKNQFIVDLYLWFSWRGDDIHPQKTFEIMNGVILSRDYPNEVAYGANNELKKASCKLSVQINKYWDVSTYPRDEHALSIVLEENASEESGLRYMPDRQNSVLDPDIRVPGWRFGGLELFATSKDYRSNFGEGFKPDGQLASYTRVVANWTIRRDGWWQAVKACCGTIVSTILAFLAFWIRPIDLDPRFGVGVGAIFALVACQYVIASTLPDSGIFSLADKLNLLSITFVLFSVVESVISLRLYYAGREEAARRLDIASFWGFVLTYGVLTVKLLAR